MYINTQTLVQASESEIRSLYPNTSFGNPFIPPEEYAFIFPSPLPSINALTQKVTQAAPELTVLGHWEERWSISDIYEEFTDENDVVITKLQQEEAAVEAQRKATVPKVVTMRQARLALLASGLLETVESAITGAGPAAKIEWEYAQEVQRAAGLVPAMATALGMTELQLDNLFILASTL
jgi:hypothetical protein